MSSHKTEGGTYFVLFKSSHAEMKVLQSFKGLNIKDLLIAAQNSKLIQTSDYALFSEDTGVLIADDESLRYFVEMGHTIVLAKTYEGLLESQHNSGCNTQILAEQAISEETRQKLESQLSEVTLQLEVIMESLELMAKDINNQSNA